MKASSLGLIVSPNGMILCAGNRAHGGFGLPGGKVKLGESLTDALVRELREETGLFVFANPSNVVRIYRGPSNTSDRMVYVFWIASCGGRLRQREPDTSLCWLSYQQLLECSPFAAFYREAWPDGVGFLRATDLLLENSSQ